MLSKFWAATSANLLPYLYNCLIADPPTSKISSAAEVANAKLSKIEPAEALSQVFTDHLLPASISYAGFLGRTSCDIILIDD